MKPLSDTLTIKSAAASGMGHTALTPRPGSTASGGMTTANPDASRAWLVSQRPDTVDARIRALLKSQTGVDVNVRREWRFPEGKAPYQVTTSAGLTGLSKANLPDALARVEAAFTPVTREQAEQMMAQMDAVLSRRGGRDDDAAGVVMDVFVNVLMSHPADVAVEAVRHFTVEPRRDGKAAWFPTPPELEAHCRALSSERHALRLALRNWKPISHEEAEVVRLEAAYDLAMREMTELERKVGPGPASDTGARGERIAAAARAREKTSEAKAAWIAANKELDRCNQ